MAFQVLFVCIASVIIQTLNAQCIGNGGANYNGINLANAGLLPNNIGLGYNGQNLPATNGGGFVVTSTSPIAPTGISVLAENLLIEGPVAVSGQLPLLATVALEGALPTGGQAGTTYGCGNGNVGIVSELGSGAAVGNGAALGNAAAIGNNVALGGIGNGIGLGGANYGTVGLNSGIGLPGAGCGRIL